MSQPLICFKGVTKRFADGTQALRRIDLTIEAGECVILNGISGSGKSTLLGLLATLERPTEGLITLEGIPISKLPQMALERVRQKTIGMVFQDFGLITHMRVYENVMAPLIPMGLSAKSVDRLVQQAMHRANISHKASTITALLSGGEKQRCAIARALVNTPKVLLCDEPTANLDLENAQAFIDLLHNLQAEGVTLLIATHDPLFAQMMPKARIVTIANGTIEEP